jgi:hypothetical protein
VAIRTTKIGMRTCGLTSERIEATRTFDVTSTAVVARPMPRPLVPLVVTAIVGQRASIWAKTTFCSQRPSFSV